MGDTGGITLPPDVPAPPTGDGTGTVDSPISINVPATAPPDTPTDLPKKHFEKYYRDVASHLETNMSVPHWAAQLIGGMHLLPVTAAMSTKDIFIAVLKDFILAVGTIVFKALDEIRTFLDPEVARFAVLVLNELLGADLEPSHLSQGDGIQAHLQRAEVVGGLFHNQLLSEFNTSGTVTPESGVKAARRFTGLAINFGTATGVIAALGGLAPFIHLDEVREIPEEVAKNLGLGRLQRLALAPLIQILLAEPYKWWINEKARPTQFKLQDIVNQFTGNFIPRETIYKSLAWEGYSDDKIEALIELHRKKLAEQDLFFLFTQGVHTDDEVLQYLKRLGYTDQDAADRKETEYLRAQEPYQKELVAAVTNAYAEAHIDRAELEGIINSAIKLENERAIALLIADYKRKVPTKHLTLAELESAFEQGILDLTEFTDYLTRLGYSPEDQQTIELLTLLKLKKIEEAAKAKAAKAAASAAKKGKTTPPPPTPTAP